MNALTLQDLLKFQPKPVPVDVPEWDRTAHVRRLSARDRLTFEGWHSGDKVPDDLFVRVAAITLSHVDGAPFFADLDEGIKTLSMQDCLAVQRIADAGYAVNDLRAAKKKSEETDTSRT